MLNCRQLEIKIRRILPTLKLVHQPTLNSEGGSRRKRIFPQYLHYSSHSSPRGKFPISDLTTLRAATERLMTLRRLGGVSRENYDNGLHRLDHSSITIGNTINRHRAQSLLIYVAQKHPEHEKVRRLCRFQRGRSQKFAARSYKGE